MYNFRGIVDAFQIYLKDGKVGSGRTFRTDIHDKAVPKFCLVGAAGMNLFKDFCSPAVKYLNVVIESSTNGFDFEDIIAPIVVRGERIENQICQFGKIEGLANGVNTSKTILHNQTNLVGFT
jgi:hypothetical protein